jgi:hypothetical protein
MEFSQLLRVPSERAGWLRRKRAMAPRWFSAALGLLGLSLFLAPCAFGQAAAYGRVGIWGTFFRTTQPDGTKFDYRELSGTVSLMSASAQDGGFEYALDSRTSSYPNSDRPQQSSIFDAWIGGRTKGGVLGLRVGQMWINDLGALGALGGGLVELQSHPLGSAGRLRFGLFGGFEPKAFDLGYEPDVRKGGAYLALDGDRGRRHTLGWILLRTGGTTERSVATFTNFIPIGKKVFIYEALEYDLTGPAGVGQGDLRYIFVNARWAPSPVFDISGNYNHGRSIDTRTITLDTLAGRPIDGRSIAGFLFESYGGRVSVEPIRGFRAYVGFSQQKGEATDPTADRWDVGLFASNVAQSGFDVTFSGSRTQRTAGSADSIFASLGRSIGRRVYVSAEYSTELSILRLTPTGDFTLDQRPDTRRIAGSAVVNLGRAFSILLSGEQYRDSGTVQIRGFTSLSYRF